LSRFDNLDDAIAWRDALQNALAEGIDSSTVSHGGRTVVYHNPLELNRLINSAQDQVNRLQRAAAGDTSRAGFSYAAFH